MSVAWHPVFPQIYLTTVFIERYHLVANYANLRFFELMIHRSKRGNHVLVSSLLPLPKARGNLRDFLSESLVANLGICCLLGAANFVFNEVRQEITTAALIMRGELLGLSTLAI